MISKPLVLPEPMLLKRNVHGPRRSAYETPAGSLILQSFCPPSLVASLKADRGLRAFARVPESELQLLLGIAERPDSALTLAYTPSGKIVGQVTLAPLDHWWQGIGNAYEIAVEVSAGWRSMGIARRLLSLALAFESLEESLIDRLFAAHGFSEYLTSEPNIRMDPANILVARLGSRLIEESMNRFYQRLFQSDTLPGL